MLDNKIVATLDTLTEDERAAFTEQAGTEWSKDTLLYLIAEFLDKHEQVIGKWGRRKLNGDDFFDAAKDAEARGETDEHERLLVLTRADDAAGFAAVSGTQKSLTPSGFLRINK